VGSANHFPYSSNCKLIIIWVSIVDVAKEEKEENKKTEIKWETGEKWAK
jgi:hypothetical protein